MKTLIVYGSRYGTARTYAETLSRRTGFETLSCDEVNEPLPCDRLIYVGSLYAGKVTGLKQCQRYFPAAAQLYMVTVGLADGSDPGALEFVRGSLKKQLHEIFYKKMRHFHLRGAVDYSTMSFVHRMMMGMLCRMLKKKPEAERNTTDKTILDSYGGQLDLTDPAALAPIEEALMQ